MTQRVEYEALGMRPDEYMSTLRSVMAHLAQDPQKDFKAFRTHMRSLRIWDKTRSPRMLDLLEIQWDRDRVNVGDVATKLAATPDDESFRLALFNLLCEQNILLVKYMFQALDVTSGGRLHSPHELYRMISSYVYPGDKPTLPNFQAWLEWMAATGCIKMVGIRWGLSDSGMEHLEDLKGMDVEEILEDMEEASLLASGAAAPAAPEVAPVEAAPVETSPEDGEADEDDLFADLPPEPEPPSDAAVAAAEAAFEETFKDVALTNDRDASSSSPARLSWESIEDPAGRHTLSRAPVPGGWLVSTSVQSHEGASGICFMPDPGHQWDLDVQDE